MIWDIEIKPEAGQWVARAAATGKMPGGMLPTMVRKAATAAEVKTAIQTAVEGAETDMAGAESYQYDAAAKTKV